MTLEEFNNSVNGAAEPAAQLSRALQALWWDAKGDWDRAHTAAQEDPGKAGAWVHAYLHRKEGDNANAGYWYARAGKPPASGSSEVERAAIAQALLSNG